MAGKAPPKGYGRNKGKRTALKLWFAVVSANIVGLFAAFYVSTYVRAGAGDPDTLFIFYWGALGLAGIVDALWLDEVVFKGAFRRNIQGKTGRFAGKKEDVEDVAASMQRSTVSFPVVVLLCCLLTYGLFNLVNNGFNSWWTDVGEHVHTLRSPDASVEAQRQAILELSRRNRPETLKIFEQELNDPEAEVAAWAAWGIGRQKQNPAMNINRVPALYQQVEEGRPAVRREALLSLSRLQHQAVADEVHEALQAELDAGGEIDLRLIWALGYLQHPDSLPILDGAMYHPDEKVQRLAVWALSQQRDSGEGRSAADLLEQRLPAAPLMTKCAIVHSLGILADERSNLALMHAYDSLTPEQREVVCKRISVFIAPDGENDREDLLMPQERYGMKTIQAMGTMRATSPQVRAEVEPWLEGLIAADETTPIVRESAQSLLSGIRAQRNDRAE